jgi:hypothetical protein
MAASNNKLFFIVIACALIGGLTCTALALLTPPQTITTPSLVYARAALLAFGGVIGGILLGSIIAFFYHSRTNKEPR